MNLNGKRYRFSVSFLEWFLMNGLQSPHKLLNKYIKELTTRSPGDACEPFTSEEPDILTEFSLGGFEWHRLKSGRLAVQLLIPFIDIGQIRKQFKKQQSLCNLT